MNNDTWIIELYGLLAEFSAMGLDDVACMSLNDLWGLYRHLNRLKEARA